MTTIKKSKKGQSWEMLKLGFHDIADSVTATLNKQEGEWLVDLLNKLSIHPKTPLTFTQLKTDFESHFQDFELFWYSKPMQIIRTKGLLTL